MFFDLNVKGNSYDNNLKLAMEASKYGWNHINFSYNQNKFMGALEFKEDLQDNLDINVNYTLEIDSNNVNDIRKIVDDALDHFGDYEEDVVMVVNHDLQVYYEIVRDPRRYVDVIAKTPYKVEV